VLEKNLAGSMPVFSLIFYADLCQLSSSFRLRHSNHRRDNKPWKRRNIRPFVPRNKEEACRVINWILLKAGLPPLKFTLKLFETKNKGGEPLD